MNRKVGVVLVITILSLVALSAYLVLLDSWTLEKQTIDVDSTEIEKSKNDKIVIEEKKERNSKKTAEVEKGDKSLSENSDDLIEMEQEDEQQNQNYEWDGEVLTAWGGVANGPSGYETYYNLPMGGVVEIMRNLGYNEEDYPYWVREDGCKMLGEYIMVAANLEVRPEGTILPISLGMGIVCDTGTFAYDNPYQLDVAVNW